MEEMKYIKLFETFENGLPLISDEQWEEFNKANGHVLDRIWDRNKLYDNGDGTYSYIENKWKSKKVILKYRILIDNTNKYYFDFEMNQKKYKDVFGKINNVHADLKVKERYGIYIDFKNFPDKVANLEFSGKCLSLKGYPISEKKTMSGYMYNLLSAVNDQGLTGEWNFLYGCEYDLIKNDIEKGVIPMPYWFESFCYVGARDFDALENILKNLPAYCKFTDEQVEEYLNSPLVDRKSTEADWDVVKDILLRMKRYDHSEYRDSKLDSEWKEIF